MFAAGQNPCGPVQDSALAYP